MSGALVAASPLCGLTTAAACPGDTFYLPCCVQRLELARSLLDASETLPGLPVCAGSETSLRQAGTECASRTLCCMCRLFMPGSGRQRPQPRGSAGNAWAQALLADLPLMPA
jgi:hypothetical protein